MFRKRVTWIVLCAIFVLAELVLAVCLQTVGGRAADLCRYAVVVLACLFCILFFEKNTSYVLTQLALICTVGADYFLVASLEPKQLPAMLFFSVTQLAYFARLYLEDSSRRRRTVHLVLRLGLSVLSLILTLAVLGEGADAVALVSMFYYANLILNLVFAMLDFRAQALMAVGFLLFLLCDTVIGLSFLKHYIVLSPDSWVHSLFSVGFDLAWAFYAPSQVLLALSLLPKRLKRTA